MPKNFVLIQTSYPNGKIHEFMGVYDIEEVWKRKEHLEKMYSTCTFMVEYMGPNYERDTNTPNSFELADGPDALDIVFGAENVVYIDENTDFSKLNKFLGRLN